MDPSQLIIEALALGFDVLPTSVQKILVMGLLVCIVVFFVGLALLFSGGSSL